MDAEETRRLDSDIPSAWGIALECGVALSWGFTSSCDVPLQWGVTLSCDTEAKDSKAWTASVISWIENTRR